MAASTLNPLARPGSAPVGLQQGRASDSALAASPLTSLGYRLTLLCVFLLVGRIPEITTALIGNSLYQVIIVILLLLPLAIITGTLVKVGSTRIGMFWTSFHMWVMLTLPLSGYRMGSLEFFSAIMRFLPITFFVGGFFIRNMETLRKGFWAMSWAGVVALAWIQRTGISEDEDRFVSVGTFGNSNLLAIYLLILIPFWGVIAANKRYRWVTRLFFTATIIFALMSILKTGSRSGMLTIGLLAILMFFGLSLANKFKFAVIGTVGVLVTLSTMSDTLKSRLSTVFVQKANDEVSTEAFASSDARYALLIESLETTLHHPFFGTGIGVYTSVAAQDKERKGEKALWLVTHNMYTQISAETGIPGFILYMTALILSVRETWRVRKRCKGDPDLQELGLLTTGLLYSYGAFCFNGCFTSMAMDFTFYSLVGFSIASSFVCQQILDQRASARSSTEQLPAERNTRSPRFFPVPATAKAPEKTPVAAPEAVDVNADAPWRKNPRKYPPKFGAPSR
jgi:O-Antigen ligase